MIDALIQRLELMLSLVGHPGAVNQNDIHNSLSNFDDLENIQDPDIKFALQLQREELELEQRRKRQHEEDEAFAMQLQSNGA